jgi:hypothetical protein
MKRSLVAALISLSCTTAAWSQNAVGIGVANPNRHAVLELVSTGNNQGVLVPKLTSAQRTATSFTSSLGASETGLLVFDSDQKSFYYWDGTAWKTVGEVLTAGTGVQINGAAIEVIPQDLELTGTTLKITNNPAATSIDLTPFSGTNTDDQQLAYDPATGELTITRTIAGPQTITLGASGAAGGDLSGTFPNPTLASNAITGAKILDGSIASADLADGLNISKLAAGTLNQVLTSTAGGTAWANPPTASGAAGGDLTGTYPNPTITANAVASAEITDGAIVDADINGTAAITVSKLASGTLTHVLTSTAGGTAWAPVPAASGTAGGDLTGTYPNPTIAANAVASAEINDGAIVNADINAAAAVQVSKLQAGTNGQVLITGGGIPQWGAVGAALINDAGTNNLQAGNSVSTGGSSNTTYGEIVAAANSGNWNVFVGSQAAQNKTTGDLNVIIGWAAGRVHPTHQGNTLVGAQAGELGNPHISTLIGEKAGQRTTGNSNVMVGERAGENVLSGFENVLIGTIVAPTNVTGTLLTIVGHNADVSADNIHNSVAIGNRAIVNASNKIRLGNTAISVIEGQVGFTAASDARLKKNIQPLKAGLDFIMSLKPVSYQMKDHNDGKTNWGFIAQDIEGLVGTTNAVLTIGEDKDRTLGLRYTDFVAPLVNAVQEQQKDLAQLEEKLIKQDAQIKALEETIRQLEGKGTELTAMKADLEKIKAALGMEASGKK